MREWRQVYFGGTVAVYTWAGFIALLLALIFIYSFIVYDAPKLQYMTPKILDDGPSTTDGSERRREDDDGPPRDV